MSNNANNYIANELSWTPYTSPEDLPDGHIVFRSKGEKSKPNKGSEYEYKFGEAFRAANRRSAVVDGYFYFDYEFWLKESEWSLISFVLGDSGA